MKITVSAPGKLEVFGEHAVVYGRPCIVTAVGQRLKVTAELIDNPIFELNAPDVALINYKKPISQLGKGDIPKAAKYVEIAVLNFFSKYQITGGVKIKTKSQFSSKIGFGSSSTSTVCTIKALSELTGKKLSLKQIFTLSHKTILDIQGRGSGVDVAAAIYGGTLYFVTAGKSIIPLKIKSLPLIIGYTGIKSDTPTILSQVAQKAKKYPSIIDDIYSQMKKVTDLAKKALLKGDFQTAGELMNFNQGYLSSLGVSSNKLEALIYAAREAGAYGAKLSGAGIGDFMIALAPKNKMTAVKKSISQADGQVIDIKCHAEGVKIER